MSIDTKLCECGCGHPAPLADSTHQGYRRGEPRRFINGHNVRLNKRWQLQHCGYETPCHVFLGSKDSRGYGRVDVRRTGERLAHRDAYAKAYGVIDEDSVVHHKCGMPSCIRLDHLQVVTDEEHRAIHKLPPRTHCPLGHEFTPENTITGLDGARRCRTCSYAATKSWYERTGRRRAS